jgi:hypothetical protein
MAAARLGSGAWEEGDDWWGPPVSGWGGRRQQDRKAQLQGDNAFARGHAGLLGWLREVC